MPLYEYKCENCNEVFEIIQRFDDEPVENCSCGGKVNKIIHGSFIKFVGTGFYCNDIKSAERKKKQEKEKTDEI